MIIVIAAQDVVPGDELYNVHAKAAPFRWSRVKHVERTRSWRSFDQADGTYPAITIHTHGWYTVKHEKEAVMIRRSSPQLKGQQ